MTYTVKYPTGYFPLENSSKANANGFVYIGAVDTDPTDEANRIPVTVIDDGGNEVVIPASAQPFQLNGGGSFEYLGSVVRLRVNVRYSMTIQASDTSLIGYFPQAVDEDTDSVELPEIATAPATKSGSGYVYSKDVLGIAELFYMDDNGDEVQLTTGGALNESPSSLDVTGVALAFFNPTVPTGWTLNTDHNDAMMRIVNSVGGGSGGTDSPTTISEDIDHDHATSDFTLTQAQLPSYNLEYESSATTDTLGAGAGITSVNVGGTATINIPSGGSGNSINIGDTDETSGLSVDLSLKYVDFIIGVKD